MREDFDGGAGYLNTASIGLPPRAASEALRQALGDWARGRAQPEHYDPFVNEARAAFGRLVGVRAQDVAVGSQVSSFAAAIASALPDGAEVVAYARDFASVLFPFQVQAARGIGVRMVELDELADAVSPRTALVAFSAVQSSDGTVADLHAIEAAAAAAEALTFVDATQAVGWLPLDATRFDFVTASAYKWLLSPRGASFMAVRPESLDRLAPIAAGWYSQPDPWGSIYGPDLRLAADARRLDLAPAWIAFVGALPALEHLERAGIDRVHAHDVGLANRFLAGLGLPPSDSAIVATTLPGAAERLARAGITAATRAGGLRASFHLYNTEEDVDRALEALNSA